MSRSTTSSSSSGLNGLRRYASAPESWATAVSSDRAGEKDDGDVGGGLVGLQPPAELDAAHPGEAEVENDRVGTLRATTASSAASARRRFLHLDVHDLEGRAEERAKRSVVVNDQQAHWRLSYSALRPQSVCSSSLLGARFRYGFLSKGNRKTPVLSSARGVLPRRGGAGAGTARTSRLRGRRAGPP